MHSRRAAATQVSIVPQAGTFDACGDPAPIARPGGALWSMVDDAFEALARALTSHAEPGTNHTPRPAGTVGG